MSVPREKQKLSRFVLSYKDLQLTLT